MRLTAANGLDLWFFFPCADLRHRQKSPPCVCLRLRKIMAVVNKQLPSAAKVTQSHGHEIPTILCAQEHAGANEMPSLPRSATATREQPVGLWISG